MADSLNLVTLAAQAGAYYREHQQELHEELTIGLFDGEFSLGERYSMIDGLTDELQLSNVVVDDFIHQHVPANAGSFNPQNNVITPSARFLKVKKYEGDLLFTDDQVTQSNLMYLGQAKLRAKQSPETAMASFIDYLFGTQIMNKAKETLRRAIIQSAFDPTGTRNWSKILDGLEARIAAEITATTIVPVALSAFTTQNVVTQVETVFDGLGTAVKSASDLIVAVSPAVYAKITRADLASLGRSDAYDGKTALTIAGYPNAKIKLEPFLQGSKVLCYRKSEAIIGFDTAGITPWEFQRADRTTKMMLNGKLDFNFQAVNLVSTAKNITYGAV